MADSTDVAWFWWPVVLILVAAMITFLTLWYVRPSETTFSDTPVIAPTADSEEFQAASGVLLLDPENREVLDNLLKADLNKRIGLPIPQSFTYHPDDLLPIRDQKSCGTCYLFNTLDALGDRIKLQSKSELSIPLSVAQMACCGTSGNGPDGRLNCGFGGYIDEALKDLERVGVVPEEEYPYGNTYEGQVIPDMKDGVVPKCQIRTALYRAFGKEPQLIRSGSAASLTVGSSEHLKIIATMKEEIYIRGPIMATIALYRVSDTSNQVDFMQYKYGTIFSRGSGTLAFHHVVSLVGWHQPNENNFDGAYWIGRNSWNPTQWPRGTITSSDPGPGFFRIRMGVNESGIEQRCFAVTPVVYKDGAQVAFRNAPTFINRLENQVISDDAHRVFLLGGFLLTGFLVAAAGFAWTRGWNPPTEIKYAIWMFILLGLALVLTLYLTSYTPADPLQINSHKTIGETATASASLTAELKVQMPDKNPIVSLWEGYAATSSALYRVNTDWEPSELLKVPSSTYELLSVSPGTQDNEYYLAWRLPGSTLGEATFEVVHWFDGNMTVWHSWTLSTTTNLQDEMQVFWHDGYVWMIGLGEVTRKSSPTATLETMTTGLTWPRGRIAQNQLWLMDRQKIQLWRLDIPTAAFELPETPWLSGTAPEWWLLGPVIDSKTLWVADEWSSRINVVNNGESTSEFSFTEGSIKALDNWTAGTLVGTQNGSLYTV